MKYLIADVSEWTDQECQKHFVSLPQSRKDRFDKIFFAEKRKASLLGDLLARRLACDETGMSLDQIQFENAPDGRPFFENVPLEVSISHSKSWVCAAISDKPIGVDIELLRETSTAPAQRVFCENEIEKLRLAQEQSDAEAYECFFKIWTAKEAYFKCTALPFGKWKSVDVLGVTDCTVEYIDHDKLIVCICEKI